MKKLTYILLVLVFITSTKMIYAQSISASKAIDIGVHFFEQTTANSPRYDAPARTIGENVVTAQALQYANRECMYIVSMPDSGWVLVSGEERVLPILAVSYDGSFPAEENMPPAMRDLLADYANEIIFIQDSLSAIEPHPQWITLENNTYTAQTSNARIGSDIYTPGDKLLERPGRGEVIWDQGTWDGHASSGTNCEYAYNKFCPNESKSIYCQKAAVGCGAVAVAQIMWYWQWPHTALIFDNIESNGDPKGNETLHLYDWELMPHQLTPFTPMEEVDMVAGFLRDCGYAIKTVYGTSSSSQTDSTKKALTHIFAYDCLNKMYRKDYSDWADKLRAEINAGRPIFYRGNDGPREGHAFVVDGYHATNSNLFHINWGWAGEDNGYYALNSLCAQGYCFDNAQAAILGIQPDPLCEPYNTNGVKSIRYGTGGALTVDTSVESGEIGAYYSGTSVTLKPGFHAKAGSKVHVAIQHFPCDGIAPASLRAPQKRGVLAETETTEEQEANIEVITDFYVSPNPVQEILQITSSEPIELVAIYTLSGEKVLQARSTQVNVSNLKEGMYIVHATSQTGNHYTAKVVKQ